MADGGNDEDTANDGGACVACCGDWSGAGGGDVSRVLGNEVTIVVVVVKPQLVNDTTPFSVSLLIVGLDGIV